MTDPIIYPYDGTAASVERIMDVVGTRGVLHCCDHPRHHYLLLAWHDIRLDPGDYIRVEHCCWRAVIVRGGREYWGEPRAFQQVKRGA